MHPIAFGFLPALVSSEEATLRQAWVMVSRWLTAVLAVALQFTVVICDGRMFVFSKLRFLKLI